MAAFGRAWNATRGPAAPSDPFFAPREPRRRRGLVPVRIVRCPGRGFARVQRRLLHDKLASRAPVTTPSKEGRRSERYVPGVNVAERSRNASRRSEHQCTAKKEKKEKEEKTWQWWCEINEGDDQTENQNQNPNQQQKESTQAESWCSKITESSTAATREATRG